MRSKTLLIIYGDKVVLGLVLLFFLWSVFGTLISRSPEEVELGEEIDKYAEKVDRNIALSKYKAVDVPSVAADLGERFEYPSVVEPFRPYVLFPRLTIELRLKKVEVDSEIKVEIPFVIVRDEGYDERLLTVSYESIPDEEKTLVKIKTHEQVGSTHVLLVTSNDDKIAIPVQVVSEIGPPPIAPVDVIVVRVRGLAVVAATINRETLEEELTTERTTKPEVSEAEPEEPEPSRADGIVIWRKLAEAPDTAYVKASRAPVRPLALRDFPRPQTRKQLAEAELRDLAAKRVGQEIARLRQEEEWERQEQEWEVRQREYEEGVEEEEEEYFFDGREGEFRRSRRDDARFGVRYSGQLCIFIDKNAAPGETYVYKVAAAGPSTPPKLSEPVYVGPIRIPPIVEFYAQTLLADSATFLIRKPNLSYDGWYEARIQVRPGERIGGGDKKKSELKTLSDVRLTLSRGVERGVPGSRSGARPIERRGGVPPAERRGGRDELPPAERRGGRGGVPPAERGARGAERDSPRGRKKQYRVDFDTGCTLVAIVREDAKPWQMKRIFSVKYPPEGGLPTREVTIAAAPGRLVPYILYLDEKNQLKTMWRQRPPDLPSWEAEREAEGPRLRDRGGPPRAIPLPRARDRY